MTWQSAEAGLVDAVEGLWQSVSELVLIVFEDQPEDADLAAVDDFTERVSEVQAHLAAARGLLQGAGRLTQRLPAVHVHLAAATTRYWRDVRAFGPVVELRRVARERGGALPAWLRGVEASARRCEHPLGAATLALNSCWQEICLMDRQDPVPLEPTLVHMPETCTPRRPS
jgi:hypothetical protein